MNIYQQKFYWKIILLVLALIIIATSLYYNNALASKLAEEERKKVELYGDTQEILGNMWEKAKEENCEPDSEFTNYLLEIIKGNTTIPVIIEDEKGRVTQQANLGVESKVISYKDSCFLADELKDMKGAGYPPVEINITAEKKHQLYYNDSTLLKQLRWYPYIQLGIIGAFLLISYLAFSAARRAEQNQVWVGMARETAHQLGTPLSSLSAWIDLLQLNEDENVQQVSEEMVKDTARLELIADRFSKIGSKPKLEEHDLKEQLLKTMNYVKRRAAKKIKFSDNFGSINQVAAKFSPPLLDWVVENLLKNALDAMGGEGSIHVNLEEKGNDYIIDVSDTGHGIKGNFNDVFKPGFSTKKRGWGLGLSLSKRIVEEYHKGKIFVHKSTVGKGTTFRIQLPK